MTKQLTVYITNEQHDWLKNQPRSFNLSAAIRLLFDEWMGTEYEAPIHDTNDSNSE